MGTPNWNRRYIAVNRFEATSFAALNECEHCTAALQLCDQFMHYYGTFCSGAMTPCMSAYELIELVHRSHELRCSCSCVYMRLAHCRTKNAHLANEL